MQHEWASDGAVLRYGHDGCVASYTPPDGFQVDPVKVGFSGTLGGTVCGTWTVAAGASGLASTPEICGDNAEARLRTFSPGISIPSAVQARWNTGLGRPAFANGVLHHIDVFPLQTNALADRVQATPMSQ